MGYVVAAVVLVGALCLFNLVLSLGLIRRVREQGRTLDGLAGLDVVSSTIPAGGRPGAFTTTTTVGRTVSLESLVSATLVGFFSPNCEPCKERVPQFLEYAGQFDGTVLSIAVGDSGLSDTRELATTLGQVGDVVVETENGPVNRAFGVRGYPALCVVAPSGQVVASGYQIDALPVPTLA